MGRQLREDPDDVRVPMQRLIDAGGKRLRPALVMLCARLGRRWNARRAARLAVATEFLHAATLVHDDYLDDAPVRRGRPTVAAAEGPGRAVAVGDYYFAKATRLVAELGDPEVISVVARSIEQICLAQLEEDRLRGSFAGHQSTYLRVAGGKTASLFEAACRAGARLGAAAPEVVEAVGRYGLRLGIAFQMRDDLLDYRDGTGKPQGQDIRQRALSLPLIYAIEDERTGPTVRQLLAGPPGDLDVHQVRHLVAGSGALERVTERVREQAESAAQALDAVRAGAVRACLTELARSTVVHA